MIASHQNIAVSVPHRQPYISYPQGTASSPVHQLVESAIGDAPIDADPGTEPEHSDQAAEVAAEGGVVDAAEEMHRAETITTSPESAGEEFVQLESAAANGVVSGNMAAPEAETSTSSFNDDKDGSFESAEVVELGDADPETVHEQPGPETKAVVGGGVQVSPAVPGADEEPLVGDVALTPTELAGAETEQAEVVTAIELANGSTAPAMRDAEVPAPGPEDARTPPGGGLVPPDAAVAGTAQQVKWQPSAEKKRQNAFGFLLKLLGWDKKGKPRSRVARVEGAAQAAGGQGSTAGPPLVSTAIQGRDSALDGQASTSADGAVISAEPLEEMTVPVPASEGVDSDTAEKNRLSQEVAGRFQSGGVASPATDSLPAGEHIEEPTSATKKNHDGGFSLPKLFGWVKQDKTSSREGNVKHAAPQVIDEIFPEGTENPLVDDEFSIAAAMMSAEGVTQSAETAADQRPPGDAEDAELATIRDHDFAEVSYGRGRDIEKSATYQEACSVKLAVVEVLWYDPACRALGDLLFLPIRTCLNLCPAPAAVQY